MKNNMAVPQKLKIGLLWSFNSKSGYVHKRIESRISKRYLYTHAYSSIIHNSQKVEATLVTTEGWMDKQNSIYAYNRVLFSHKKIENSDTCYNMDKLWRHYAKWTKPITKGPLLWFYLYEILSQYHRDRKQNGDSRGLVEGARELLMNGYRVSGLQMEEVMKMDAGDGDTT